MSTPTDDLLPLAAEAEAARASDVPTEPDAPSAPSRPASRPISSPARRPPRPVSSMQIVFGSILAISMLLAINFSGRIAAGRAIEAQRAALARDIEALEARSTLLKRELSYYSDDAFVEQWARGEGKMVRENEFLVVPVPGQVTATPQAAAAPAPIGNIRTPEPQNWRLWWGLFFDGPPPGYE